MPRPRVHPTATRIHVPATQPPVELRNARGTVVQRKEWLRYTDVGGDLRPQTW